jgi:hypothetical protein
MSASATTVDALVAKILAPGDEVKQPPAQKPRRPVVSQTNPKFFGTVDVASV